MQIYMITNTVNGKIYIGKNSSSNPEYMGSGIILAKAKAKYGLDAFKKTIIEDGIVSEELLNEREIYWIKKYEATNPAIGYNRAPGGEGNTGKWNGDSLSDEHRENISKSLRGRKILWNDVLSESRKSSEVVKSLYDNPDWRNKISEALSGKSKSESHRKNLSEALNSSSKFKESRSSEEFKEKCSSWQRGKKRDEAYMKKWLETKTKNTAIRQAKDKDKLIEVLKINNYDVTETSKYLNCHKNTILRKIKKYNINNDQR